PTFFARGMTASPAAFDATLWPMLNSVALGLSTCRDFSKSSTQIVIRLIRGFMFRRLVESSVLWQGRIKFIFRNCRVHLIPRLRVRNENIHLRAKPAWIIQAAGGDSDKSRGSLVGFAASDSRAAVRTKAAFVFAACQARCEMVAQLSLRQTKCRRGHEQTGDESAARHSLAVAAMTLERDDGFSRCRGSLQRSVPSFLEAHFA